VVAAIEERLERLAGDDLAAARLASLPNEMKGRK
jgi:hypothetical protein